MSAPRIDSAGRILDPPTVTIHRSSLIWSSVALLLLWIWSVWMGVEMGRTMQARDVAHAAQERAWRASVR